MLNKKFFQSLNDEHNSYESQRKAIIGESNTILHSSKRVIFALHRGDIDKAIVSLEEIERSLIGLEKQFSFARLNAEGSYKAGVEEYVEAKMLYQIIKGEKIDIIKGVVISFDSYLAGLCDVMGELVRRAINKAATGEYDEVRVARDVINEIMGELVEFDMTGYLRTKYDQAKSNLRKIEQIMYEVRS
ncbi:hypothetical protein ISS03_04155 [Patescibacteria group bacterium]|nr:hypothetical protein [Patescibacteria group bacterium]